MDDEAYADTPLRPPPRPRRRDWDGGPDAFREPPTSNERGMALCCHLGGYLTSFLAPLVLWLTHKDESAFVTRHAKEALNFQVTLIVWLLLLGLPCGAVIVLGVTSQLLALVIIGIVVGGLALMAFGVVELILIILACVAAHGGKEYRYPLCIRLF
jgi:uncharacterized Tic20 family protein